MMISSVVRVSYAREVPIIASQLFGSVHALQCSKKLLKVFSWSLWTILLRWKSVADHTLYSHCCLVTVSFWRSWSGRIVNRWLQSLGSPSELLLSSVIMVLFIYVDSSMMEWFVWRMVFLSSHRSHAMHHMRLWKTAIHLCGDILKWIEYK